VPVNKNRIRELREAKGWTQQQAATAAGLSSRQHWNNIESGRQKARSISVEQLERIAEAFGVAVGDLLTPTAPSPRKRAKK